MTNEWKTIEKGYLGDLLVEKRFIEHGFNLFKPVLENGKVDLIVEKNNVYLKIQIKTVQTSNGSRIIPVRKISNSSYFNGNASDNSIKKNNINKIEF